MKKEKDNNIFTKESELRHTIFDSKIDGQANLQNVNFATTENENLNEQTLL